MTYPLLEQHLQEKLANRDWLEACLSPAATTEDFPYFLAEKATGSVMGRKVTPLKKNTELPACQPEKPENPLFLVNIPFVPKKTKAATHQALHNLVDQIASESFGKTAAASRIAAQKRVAVVIGVNRPLSLDGDRNAQMKRWVRKTPKIEGIACRVFGFFWKPKWQQREDMDELTYSAKKSYLLLKGLAPAKAAAIREELEGKKGLSDALRSQIPYQGIRENIFRGQDTADLLKHFTDNGNGAPTYLSCSDDDFVTLRQSTGLYSAYSGLIKKHRQKHGKLPFLLSTAYALKDDELPLLKKGVDMDRAVRAATARFIPLGPYYPEPNFLYLLNRQKYLQGRYSFLGAGGSANLESRRFLQNAQKCDQLDTTSVVFSEKHPLVTRTPARMKTKKSKGTKVLTKKKIKQKSVLQGFRSVSQSHAFPKQWADNLYIALPITAPVTTVTQPLMRIYNVFHPISLILAWKSDKKKYTSKNFDEVSSFYTIYRKKLLQAFLTPATYKQSLDDFVAIGETEEQQEEYRTLFANNYAILLHARVTLTGLGLNQTWRDNIAKAAEASGKAIFDCLQI